MRYLSVCSGIEAATVAWKDWQPAAFSEIEKFPSQVLAHHYPSVSNLGDMTKYKEWDLGSIDLLVGGTPCQSFSVAGLRKGMDDPRGNLALVYCGILDHFRPRWFVWENVPGVLSSNGGRDFGSFLGAVAQLGYGFAYRVLDAQWFGVAQRRRRVFVVGHLGDWRSAAAVLFERQSLRGDTKPSREKGQEVAGTIARSAFSGGAGGRPEGAAAGHFRPVTRFWNGNDYEEALTRTSDDQRMPDKGRMQMVVQPVSIQGNLIGREAGGPQGVGASDEGVMYTLTKADVHGVTQKMAVRRLTPIECERLQGFPDNYTNIKENCPDGPRYKALGNSMAVPVMRWIGDRIDKVCSVN
jgi:DNA (cytosine-5)-methyltransferase 1